MLVNKWITIPYLDEKPVFILCAPVGIVLPTDNAVAVELLARCTPKQIFENVFVTRQRLCQLIDIVYIIFHLILGKKQHIQPQQK